jgi:hypothetical protein
VRSKFSTYFRLAPIGSKLVRHVTFGYSLCLRNAQAFLPLSTSGSSHGKDWVQSLQLHRRIRRPELPINPYRPKTPIRHPPFRHGRQCQGITNPFTQRLTSQRRPIEFLHVQPASVFWRELNQDDLAEILEVRRKRSAPEFATSNMTI